jgi:hypothetical protein
VEEVTVREAERKITKQGIRYAMAERYDSLTVATTTATAHATTRSSNPEILRLTPTSSFDLQGETSHWEQDFVLQEPGDFRLESLSVNRMDLGMEMGGGGGALDTFDHDLNFRDGLLYVHLLSCGE